MELQLSLPHSRARAGRRAHSRIQSALQAGQGPPALQSPSSTGAAVLSRIARAGGGCAAACASLCTPEQGPENSKLFLLMQSG